MSEYQPQLGDVGLVHMTGVGGVAIRVGQWLNGDSFADYEHAFVVVGAYIRGADTGPADAVKIVEAMPGGALLSPLSYYDDEHLVFLRCPEEFRSAVAAAALGLVNTPYSIADYFALAAHRFRIPVPGLKHYVETSDHLICSQLADRAAANGGWRLFADGRWEGYVTPGDLHRLYVAQKHIFGR